MKKIGFLCLAKYPVPAVKGGAVETLVTNLLNENETNHLMDMIVFSFFDREALSKSRGYRNSKFHFIRKSLAFKLGNKIIQKTGRLFGKSESLYYYSLRRKMAEAELDALVLEASAGYAQRIHQDFPTLPLYFHVHNIPEKEHYPRNFHNVIDRCLCISQFILNETEKQLGFERRKMNLLYNAVDTRLFVPITSDTHKNKLRRELGFSEDDKLIIFTGRLQEYKGVKQLLEAFIRIKDPHIGLMIVGSSFFTNSKSTPFIEELKRIADEKKEQITFTGHVDHDKICKYYQMADVAVLPSMWEEPFGLTCIEALACGLPVITSRSGGIPEIVTNECGVVLERDNNIAYHIQQNIERILGDVSLRSQMSRKARARSLCFDSKDYLINFDNIITNQNTE
jgi:glycosyltransferase involved in cell wall biosynthesis